MSGEVFFRVPDVIDKLFDDVVSGLYTPLNIKNSNRILLAKLNLSCDLLVNTKLEESIICKKLDFDDLEIFRELFNKYLGILPNQFRERFGNCNY